LCFIGKHGDIWPESKDPGEALFFVFFFLGKSPLEQRLNIIYLACFFLRILASQMMICILLDLFNWFVLPVVNPSGVEWLSHGYAPQHHGWRHMATMARVIYRTIPAFP